MNILWAYAQQTKAGAKAKGIHKRINSKQWQIFAFAFGFTFGQCERAFILSLSGHGVYSSQGLMSAGDVFLNFLFLLISS